MKYNYGDLPKSEIEVNSKRKVKTNRVQSLLDATADLDDYGTDDCVLASDLLAKAEKKKVERNQSAIKQEDDDFQYYLNGMNSMQDEAVDFSFGVKSAKKKKKKDKKKPKGKKAKKMQKDFESVLLDAVGSNDKDMKAYEKRMTNMLWEAQGGGK